MLTMPLVIFRSARFS